MTGESRLYNLLRKVLRLWFSLIFRRIRVLNEAALPASGPAILVVNHPAGFAEALLLVAALGRRVHCLLDRSLASGFWEGVAARALGMIRYDFQEEDWARVLESACKIFSRDDAVLIFATRYQAGEGFAPVAAEVAVEAEAYLGREAPLPVLPVHLFIPVPPSGAGEVMVHIDAPVVFSPALKRSEDDLSKRIHSLDQSIEKACSESPFRLQPEVIKEFLEGIEAVMREDFAERWSHRPHWKQKIEDFDLSPFLVRLTHQLNYTHPGRVAALNGALRTYQERKRRSALTALLAETAGPWRNVFWKRICVWVETIAGFPIACYGLLNLLLAWFIIWLAGLLKNGLWGAGPKVWSWRAFIALCCYALQIGVASHYLTRAQTGYYAPSIFISGAYLLRYLWLLRRRTRVLAGEAGKGRRSAAIRRLRVALIDELKHDQDRYAAALKIAH